MCTLYVPTSLYSLGPCLSLSVTLPELPLFLAPWWQNTFSQGFTSWKHLTRQTYGQLAVGKAPRNWVSLLSQIAERAK